MKKDEEVEAILDCYRALCTPSDREFYDLVCKFCPDQRLALFLTPQRLMVTMVRLTRPDEKLRFVTDRRVDFAVEVPALNGSGWFRLVVEIDDPSHTGAQKDLDAQRDDTLKRNGWEVWRLSTKAKNDWESRARELIKRLCDAITDEVIQAAKTLNTLPTEQRRALMDLVLLPVAEAQLTTAVARWLHAKGTANIRIANPQGMNLQPVLDCIDECLSNLEMLYGLPNLGRPILADTGRIRDRSGCNLLRFAIRSSMGTVKFRYPDSVGTDSCVQRL